MQHQISGPFMAGELFRLEEHVREGVMVPPFANLKAVMKVDARDSRFTGTGIYGVFFKGMLIYVGIFTGRDSRLFSGSVVQERWRKHLTFFTLRSPECAATPGNIRRIVSELTGEPVDAITSLMGGPDVSIEACRRRRIGFTLGSSTQFNKVRFAVENWNSLAPGNEEEMLASIGFVYARFLPETGRFLDPVRTRKDYDFVKQHWLEPREKHLYESLRPICNKHTKEPNRSVDVRSFRAALGEQMRLPLPPIGTQTDMRDSRLLKQGTEAGAARQ